MNKFLKDPKKLTELADIFVWLANDAKGEDFENNHIWDNFLKEINNDPRFTNMWALSIIDMMNETGLYFRKIKLPEGCFHVDIEISIKKCLSEGGFYGFNHLLDDKIYTPKKYEHNINRIIYKFNKTNVNDRNFVIFTLDLFFFHMLNLGYRAIFRNTVGIKNILNNNNVLKSIH